MTGGCRPLQSALRSPSSLGNCPNKLSSLSLISPIKGRAARNEGRLRTLPPSGIHLRDCILSVCSRKFRARARCPAGERERPSEHRIDRTVQGFLASAASRGLARNLHIGVEVDRGAHASPLHRGHTLVTSDAPQSPSIALQSSKDSTKAMHNAGPLQRPG